MANKIARIDAEAMNSLFAAELTKAGVKVAATDDNGQDKGIQAFADHADYIATVKSAVESDKKAEGSTPPNDPILD